MKHLFELLLPIVAPYWHYQNRVPPGVLLNKLELDYPQLQGQ